MELCIEAWTKEQDEMSENFQKLCKCHKTLSKKDKDLAFYVANRQTDLLKRVIELLKCMSVTK